MKGKKQAKPPKTPGHGRTLMMWQVPLGRSAGLTIAPSGVSLSLGQRGTMVNISRRGVRVVMTRRNMTYRRQWGWARIRTMVWQWIKATGNK